MSRSETCPHPGSCRETIGGARLAATAVLCASREPARSLPSLDAGRAGIFELSVQGAGACHGEPQKARKAKKHKDDEITIGQREQVVKAAEALLVTSRKATTAAVAIRMGPGIPRARIRTILRSHKRKYGAGTSEWTVPGHVRSFCCDPRHGEARVYLHFQAGCFA